MGTDDASGWVVWHTPDVYYAYRDYATESTAIVGLARPTEWDRCTPLSADWWLVLGRLLQLGLSAVQFSAGQVLWERHR